jgi:hypothetical protein
MPKFSLSFHHSPYSRFGYVEKTKLKKKGIFQLAERANASRKFVVFNDDETILKIGLEITYTNIHIRIYNILGEIFD